MGFIATIKFMVKATLIIVILVFLLSGFIFYKSNKIIKERTADRKKVLDLLSDSIFSYPQNEICKIIYTDANGKQSTREIEIKQIYVEDGNLYLKAFCHLKNAIRNFKVERINRMWSRGQEIDYPEKYFLDILKGIENIQSEVSLVEDALED